LSFPLGAAVREWISIGVADEQKDLSSIAAAVHSHASEEGVARELVQLVGVPVGCDQVERCSYRSRTIL
jgi:hypothetical protein